MDDPPTDGPADDPPATDGPNDRREGQALMVTTAQDKFQAQRFLNQRARAALIEGDAESTDRSLSRLGAGAIAGILVTIVLLATVGVIGVLRPGGSTAWQQPGAFIVAKETGARYVYLEGVLHPVVNYASARLLLGSDLHVVTVSVRSLESAPYGPAIGIGMAPDSLPDSEHVVGTDWSVCAAGDISGGAPLHTAALPGQLANGTPLDNAGPPQDQAYLIRTTGGHNYLITTGYAHQIDDQWLPALGYQAADAAPVADDFVTALPVGQPFAPPTLPGLGQPGPALPGSAVPAAIGSIFADRLNAYYLMTADGLVSLTKLQARLLLADRRLTVAYGGSNPTPLPINQAQVAGATVQPLPDVAVGGKPPSDAPALSRWPPGAQQLCVRYGSQQVPDFVVGPAESATTQNAGLVQLPTGSGALIAARPSPNTPPGKVYLVADSGMRYPVAGQQALERLGLAGVSVAQLPQSVVDLLPEGPLLDPAAAALPAS